MLLAAPKEMPLTTVPSSTTSVAFSAGPAKRSVAAPALAGAAAAAVADILPFPRAEAKEDAFD